jgi:hypothetical protein
MKYIFIILILIFITNCEENDSGPADTDSDNNPADCDIACANLTVLDCALSEGGEDENGNWMSCEEICMYMMNQGVPLNPICLAQIEACDQEDQCMEGK